LRGTHFVEKFEHVLKVVLSVVNFIRSHGLSHRQFELFYNRYRIWGRRVPYACRETMVIFFF
jgi:hypothetical protein